MLKIGVMVDRPGQVDGLEVVEILGKSGVLPSLEVLARWRAEMDENLDVVVTAPSALTAPGPDGQLTSPFHPMDEALTLWERLHAALQVLESKVVLFKTGPEFTPTNQNKDRLTEFFSRAAEPDLRLVWQPRGLWAPEDLAELSASCPVVLARDPLAEDLSFEDWVYWRVWGLGRAELGPADMEVLLDRALDDRLDGYCVLATGVWKSDIRAAAGLLARVEAQRRAEA